MIEAAITRPQWMTAEKARLCAIGLSFLAEDIREGITVTPSTYTPELQRSGNEPIAHRHETYTALLFDGINAGKAELGTNFAESLRTTPEHAISYSRGVALQVLVNGGIDIESYVTALASMPSERVKLAQLAIAIWNNIDASSEDKQSVARLILIVHPTEIGGGWRERLAAVADDTSVEASKGAFVSELQGRAMVKAEARLARKDYLNPGKEVDVPEDFVRAAAEGDQIMIDTKTKVLVKQMVISRLCAHIVSDGLGTSAGGESLSVLDVASKSQDLDMALQHTHLLQPKRDGGGYRIMPETVRIGNMGQEYAIPEHLRAMVVKVNFVGDLIANSDVGYAGGDNTARQAMEAYFRQGQEYGVTKAELIALYNKVVMYLVSANEVLARQQGSRFNPSRDAIKLVDVIDWVGLSTTGAFMDHVVQVPWGRRVVAPDGSVRSGLLAIYDDTDEGLTDEEAAEEITTKQKAQKEIDTELTPIMTETAKLAGAERAMARDRKARERSLYGLYKKEGWREFEWTEHQRTALVHSAKATEMRGGLEKADEDISGFDDELATEKHLFGLMKTWEADDNWENLPKFGKGAIALARLNGQRAKVEAEIRTYVGRDKDVDLGDPKKYESTPWKRSSRIGEIMSLIVEERRRRVRAKAEHAAQKVKDAAAKFPQPQSLVSNVLRETSVPPYNPSDQRQIITEIRVPSNYGEPRVENIATLIDLDEDELIKRLKPLRDECLSVYQAYRNALMGYVNSVPGRIQGDNYASTEPLRMALDEIRRNSGDLDSVAKMFAETMKGIFLRLTSSEVAQLQSVVTAVDVSRLSEAAGVAALVAKPLEDRVRRMQPTPRATAAT